MTDTRTKLLAAAADTVREQGTAGASARVIAARAGVNQALVFYHFGTVSRLLDDACRRAVEESVAGYREQFAAVRTFRGLLDVGRELDRRERAAGNVAMMAQLMSGAGRDPVLAGAARHAMDLWSAEVQTVVERVLGDGPLSEIVDSAGLARAVSASFIGLQLYEDVDADGAARALAAWERLGVLVEVVDDLGPLARRALRSRLKGISSPSPAPS